MAKKLGKLISRVGLSIGSVAVSAGAFYVFIGSSNGDTKQPNQVVQPSYSVTIPGNDNRVHNPTITGNDNLTVGEAPNSHIDQRRYDNRTTNNVRGQQINAENYNEICPSAKIDRGSNCVNNGSVTNNF